MNKVDMLLFLFLRRAAATREEKNEKTIWLLLARHPNKKMKQEV